MEHNSYCGTLDFPPYISFDDILKKVNSLLDDDLKKDIQISSPAKVENINYTIFQNKDGKYAWRPIQLTHPVLYMLLVRSITKEENWNTICKRFKYFKTESKIKCMSLPVKSLEKKQKNRSEQILFWWENTEQESIKQSLEYEYLANIDISNCYGSIYTHSIPWAIYGKEEAKKNRGNKRLIGNIIDEHLRDISYGQTNGIPQGSVLMDFIAEIVLGYIDCEITKKINQKNCHIIRYRDDYRIFTKNITDGKEIIKIISEILIEYGMSLNTKKTKISDQIIQDSIKPDKLYWIQQTQKVTSLQKKLISIHALSKKFPNSGSLKVALMGFYDKIKKAEKVEEIKERSCQLISIIVDIAYHNPGTYQISLPIISQLIKHINKEEQTDIIFKIKEKFKSLPNTGHLDIWLQRVLIGCDENISNKNISFKEPICKIINGEKNISIWKNNWLYNKFKTKVKDNLILDKEEIEKVTGKPIARNEFELFPEKYQ